MSVRPEAKGWCPGAYKPMISGDGLVVRVRPGLARLNRTQILELCDAAQTFGSGLIDLTSRANLQIRGVSEADHKALLERLNEVGLLPDDPELESRRNILVAPLWEAGDATTQVAKNLTARLAEFPELPAKMGFAIDLSSAPQFTQNSADIRFECTADGGLMLRADGMSRGRPVTLDTAVDAALEFAEWFKETGGIARRRMAAHVALTPPPAAWQASLPAAAARPSVPSVNALGSFVGAAFGQIDATQLERLVTVTDAHAIRVTPWRLILLEGVQDVLSEHFITKPNDPLLSIDACPGAPLCSSASVETRNLARALAPQVRGALHISGCAKGCARPRACSMTLVGRDGQFDLIRNGTPWGDPEKTGLTPENLIKVGGAL